MTRWQVVTPEEHEAKVLARLERLRADADDVLRFGKPSLIGQCVCSPQLVCAECVRKLDCAPIVSWWYGP